MTKKKSKLPNIAIRVPDNMQMPAFSNIAQVNATDREIVFDFAFVQPNSSEGVIVSKVVLTPEHAKSLSAVLNNILEKHYGEKKAKK